MKKINKILYVILVPALRVVDFINARVYMHLYNRLLKWVGVKLEGKPRYISTTVLFDDFSKISLGEYVVISKDVILLTHDYSVTTALRSINLNPKTDIASDREIRIGRNVFIGIRSVVLPGSTIGDNVIIGAGTVIKGNIPSNSVVTGNPAEIFETCEDRGRKIARSVDRLFLRVDK